MGLGNNSGDMVKKYRTLLKISQKEAAGNRMSHSMISLIESGKIQMTTVTAMILADNFNKIAASKGIDLNLSLRDLFCTQNCGVETELRNAFNDAINRNSSEEEYEEIFEKAKENNYFSLMAEIKQHHGNMAAEKEDYFTAIEQYNKANDFFKLTQDNNSSLKMMIKLAKCHNILKHHKAAEEYVEKIKDEIAPKYQDDQTLFQANLELLTAMINTNRNNEALKIIESILKNKRLNTPQRNEILMIRSCIFIDEKRFEDAANILKKMISGNKDSDYIVYHKLAVASILLGHRQEGIFYLSQCIDQLSTSMNKDNTKISFKLAEELENYNIGPDSIKYFDFALTNSRLFKQNEYRLKCYRKLFEIYSKYSEIGNFEKYMPDLKRIVTEEKGDSLINYLILMVRFYLQTAKIDELKSTIDELSAKL